MNTINLADLVKYSFLDPAGSKKSAVKKVRANSAIVTVGVERSALQRIFVLEAWRGRDNAPQLIERVLATNERWHPQQFGVEANAMQSLFAELVAHEAQRLQKNLPLVPITQPTKIDKEWRVRDAVQPVIGNGRLFLLESQVELIEEITSFPLGEFRDMIDALASVIAHLIPIKPPAPVVNEERQALARYLRRVGMPPEQIESRLAKFDAQHLYAAATTATRST